MKTAIFQQFQVVRNEQQKVSTIYGLDSTGQLWRIREDFEGAEWRKIDGPGREAPKDGIALLTEQQEHFRKLNSKIRTLEEDDGSMNIREEAKAERLLELHKEREELIELVGGKIRA